MARGLETRFERCTETMIQALGHADRVVPARWYLRGLMLPGSRKSVDPMAARVYPQDVRSAHQSMHHLEADSEWKHGALLAAVAREVVPMLTASGEEPCYWIIDDTGHRKYRRHTVGVARQYCGQMVKVDNCQVAVSLSLATAEGSLPLSYQLYLPEEWAEDKACRMGAGVLKEIAFATKGEMARAQIEAQLAAGIPRGPVLMDAAYGDEAAFRDWLSARELPYAAGCARRRPCGMTNINPRPYRLRRAVAGSARGWCGTKPTPRSASRRWPKRCRKAAITRSPGAKAPKHNCARALRGCVRHTPTGPARRNGC